MHFSNKLVHKITDAILDRKEGLDNIPSLLIAAIVKRTITEMEQALPTTADGDYTCSVEDIFGEWDLCECGKLIQLEQAVHGEDCTLCLTCAEELRLEHQKNKHPG